MRVTFVLPGWVTHPTGGARVVYRYASELAARGHQVTVVHGLHLEPWQLRPGLRWRRELRNAARAVVDRAHGRPSTVPWEVVHPAVELRYASTLASAHVPDADVVVATAWRTAESVQRYGPAKGAKCYLIQHHETWDATAARVDATWAAGFTIVVIAAWLARIAERLGVGPVCVVPNAIDLDEFRPGTPSDRRPHRVAMLYSPAPLKGAEVGVEALERARRDVPDLEAVLFGVRPRPRSLPSWIEYHQDPERSSLVRDVYGTSALYLCPSFGEGWHLPPAEAMACGCAVVSTDIDGVADYAIDNETALLRPVGDAAELAKAVVELCRDDEQRERLAQAARRRIQAFSWERSTSMLEGVLATAAT